MQSSRHHAANALPKPDSPKFCAFAVSSENHFVAVLEEGPCLAARKRQRLASAPRALEKTSPRFLRRPRHGAAREQIAGSEIAAIARVMRDELRDGPVHVRESPRAHAEWRRSGLAHARGAQIHLERDVERTGFHCTRRAEIRERRRVA